MIETARAYEWLYDVLSTDTSLTELVSTRIYRHVVPAGVQRPAVVFTMQGGHDVLGVGATRIMVHVVAVVKAVGLHRDYASLVAIADLIDAALHRAVGQVDDARVLACVREVPLDYIEASDGEVYAHIGGQYRLLIQEQEPEPEPEP